MNQIKIGEFIKSLRKAKGLSQQEVADTLLVTQKTVSRWENGEGVPDISILKDVASFFDITVDELLDGERKTKEQSTSTIKRKESDRTKLVTNNISNSLNIFLMSSLGVFGGLILIGLILLFTTNNKFSTQLISLLGAIAGFVIYFIGYKNNKNKLNDEDLDFVNIDTVNKEINQKNLLFSDIYFSLFILALVISYFCFIINPLVYAIYFVNYSCLLGILITGYFLFRSFIKEGKIDKSKLKKNLNILFTVSMISIILFAIHNVVRFNSPSSHSTSVTYDADAIPSFGLFLSKGASSYLFRSIGISLIILSISLMILFTIKNKFIFNLIVSIIGFIGSFVMTLDFTTFAHKGYNIESNFGLFAIITIIIAIAIAVFQFILIFKEKKEEKNHE